MSNSNSKLTISKGFETYMPNDYVDLVRKGQIKLTTEGKKPTVRNMGSFKELLEEHPMCAGCAMTLFIRQFYISLPNPEDTVVLGTAGCARLSLSQAAVPFIYGNYGDTNAVASGVRRTLDLRFPDKKKDVICIAGDGGLADIGFSMTLHSWIRGEKFVTIMVDNETYGNTGGQESAMTQKGAKMKMSPGGKQFDKLDMPELAKTVGCAYVAVCNPYYPRKVEQAVEKAIIIAREVGPTYIQAYTSCNIEYAIPPEKVLEDAINVEKERYGQSEYMTPAAEEYWNEYAEAKKAKKKEAVA